MTLKSNNNKIPPYVPYRTFRTFLEFLKEGIPDRIDRSVWVTRFSGSSGMQLMTSLKALSLIDDYGRPSPQLEKLVFAQGRERRDLMKQILEDFYSPLFNLDLKKATKNQFREAFRIFGAKEGVLTKCEAFFIKAAKDSGIELSQYIIARTHGNARNVNSVSKTAGGILISSSEISNKFNLNIVCEFFSMLFILNPILFGLFFSINIVNISLLLIVLINLNIFVIFIPITVFLGQ